MRLEFSEFREWVHAQPSSRSWPIDCERCPIAEWLAARGVVRPVVALTIWWSGESPIQNSMPRWAMQFVDRLDEFCDHHKEAHGRISRRHVLDVLDRVHVSITAPKRPSDTEAVTEAVDA